MTSRTPALAGCFGAAAAMLLSACGTDSPARHAAPATVTERVIVTDESTASVPSSHTETSPAPLPSTSPATTLQRPAPDSASAVSPARFTKAPGEYYFASPSRNVYCGFRPANGPGDMLAFGCQTMKSVAPVDGPVCRNTANNTYLVTVQWGRIVHRCTSQGVYIPQDPQILAYGESVTIRGTTCVSSTDGVACWPGDLPGFLLSRERNEVLG
ncbi:hypothetical protein AAFP30_26860 [Gordonia sp. CPCC 205515]|uniref:hypothetical protein n=1 Tax=Gordonia sp. CPCC 205515 TaxID=3140791 RepID=UPI003AF34E52